MRAEQAVIESNKVNERILSSIMEDIKFACSEGLYEIEHVDKSCAGIAEKMAYKLSRLGYITVIKDSNTIKIGW